MPHVYHVFIYAYSYWLKWAQSNSKTLSGLLYFLLQVLCIIHHNREVQKYVNYSEAGWIGLGWSSAPYIQ